MKRKIEFLGYAVREADNLRTWFKKRTGRGPFGSVSFTTAKGEAKLYRTHRGATSVAEWMNKRGFRYADGTAYRFTVEPVFAD